MSSPGGREVGRLSIRVVPNTSRFRTDLKRFLDQVERTSHGARIQVDLDDSKITSSLKRLDDNVKKATSAGIAIKAHPELREGFREELQAKVAAAAKGIQINIPVDLDEQGIKNFNNTLGQSNRQIVNVNRSGGIFSRIARGMVRGLSSIGTMAGQGLGSLLQMGTGAVSTMGKLGGAMGNLVGIAALVIGGVGLISGAIGLLAAVTLGAAGALGTLVGAAPTLLSALGPPIAAIAVGMDGIKKAAEVLTPEFDRMKHSVSQAFEIGLVPAFQTLNTIMPMLTTELGHVATRLSGLAQEAATFLASAQGVQIIKDIFAGFGIVVDRAKLGVGELAKQVLITAGHAPTLRVLGDILSNMTSGIAGFIQKARESGALTSTFAVLRDILSSAGGWLEDLVFAGMEFLQGAGPGIQQFFENLRSAFSQVDFKSFGRAFGEMLASLANLDPATVASFFRSLENLFRSIEKFMNSGVMDILLGTFSNFTSILAGIISPISTVVGWFGKLYHWAGGTPTAMERASGAVSGGMASMAGSTTSHSQTAANNFQSNMGRIPPAAQLAGAGASNNMRNSLGPMPGTAQNLAGRTAGNITAGLAPMPSAAQHVGNITHGNLRNSMAPIPGMAGSVGNDAANQWGAGVGRSAELGRQAGDDGGAGFIQGLRAWLGAAWGIGAELARMAWNAAKSALGIASPSKRFAELGHWSGEGFIVGIREMFTSIVRTMQDVMARVEASSGWSSVGQGIAQQLANGLNGALPDLVRLGTVSDKVWDQLLAAGWKGNPNDSMEALYRPQGNNGQDLFDAVFQALNGAKMQIDGAGVARIVNERNIRNRPR